MNLGKLLFAGNSVVNGNAAVSYRADKRVALPKFSAMKNPFTPKPATESAPEPDKMNPASQPAAQKAAPVSSSAKALASWTGKFNPVALWHGPAATPQKTLPAVQAELSLDTVKVVHNDLSDADVEVVPIKSRSAAEVPNLPPAKKSWEIIGEQLLRATAL